MDIVLLSVLSDVGSFFMGLLSVFLYSFLLAIVLLPVYVLATLVFGMTYKKGKNWVFHSLITAFVLGLVFTIIMYFVPYLFFGWQFESFRYLETFWDWVSKIFFVILNIVKVAAIIALVAQPFAMLFSYCLQKFEKLNSLLKIYFSLYVVAFAILFVYMLFPWIFGGIILMIYF